VRLLPAAAPHILSPSQAHQPSALSAVRLPVAETPLRRLSGEPRAGHNARYRFLALFPSSLMKHGAQAEKRHVGFQARIWAMRARYLSRRNRISSFPLSSN